jgi:heme oxygenase
MNTQMLGLSVQPVERAVIEALRDATRTRHAQLGASSAMSRLFDAEYTIQEYQSHLGRLLGLFEPLEYAVACATDRENPVCPLERSSALREDLAIMGATASDIEGLERCNWLPYIAPAGLYGYAYVVLGSMKGGKIIVKRLRSILGPAASFQFYGDEDGSSDALWASFCSELEAHGKENVEVICATAVTVFEAYAAWLSGPLRQPGNG